MPRTLGEISSEWKIEMEGVSFVIYLVMACLYLYIVGSLRSVYGKLNRGTRISQQVVKLDTLSKLKQKTQGINQVKSPSADVLVTEKEALIIPRTAPLERGGFYPVVGYIRFETGKIEFRIPRYIWSTLIVALLLPLFHGSQPVKSSVGTTILIIIFICINFFLGVEFGMEKINRILLKIASEESRK